jgi:hypothetical protein
MKALASSAIMLAVTGARLFTYMGEVHSWWWSTFIYKS